MKYITIIILLLVPITAFSQTHHYTFDGIVRKPWTFYKVVNGELKALPDSEQVSNKTKHWDSFILTIHDITVDCVGNYADVTITYNKGKARYLLTQSAPNKYIFKNDAVNLMLITKSSLVCEFYFIKAIDATSVSNMDWEMAQ